MFDGSMVKPAADREESKLAREADSDEALAPADAREDSAAREAERVAGGAVWTISNVA